VVSHTKILVRL